MLRHIRDIKARRRGETVESGFTLIELLIVIVVLGILAATVIFALGGVTTQSAKAACLADGASYNTAVAAYEAWPANTTNAGPAGTDAMLSGGPYGAFLHTWANNPHYVVAVAGDTGTVNFLGTGTIPAVSVAFPAGTVYVGPPNTTLVPYDTETATTGCNAVT